MTTVAPSLDGAVVVFDLDGTLVDTAPDLAAAMNAVLAADGLPTLPVSEVRHLVGGGAKVLIRRGYAEAGLTMDGEELEKRVVAFLDHYRPNVAATSRPFDGVETCLRRLAEDGARLSVCTNKPAALAEDLLEQLGLAAHFGAIVGGDTLPVKKPDAAPLREAARRVGDSGQILMVGDSAADVGAARNAGVAVTVVSFGYSDGPPEHLGADAMIDHFDELHGVARRLLQGAPAA